MTNDQMDEAAKLFRSLLKARGASLPSEAVGQVLSNGAVWPELLAVFEEHVKAFNGMIVRKGRADRTLTPHQALEATGRKLYPYSHKEIIPTIPREGDGEEKDVYFFLTTHAVYNGRGEWDSNATPLAREFTIRGLRPAPPYLVADVNARDPSFAEEYPNGTWWVGEDGNPDFLDFLKLNGEQIVSVLHRFDSWTGIWWVAGVKEE